MKARLGQPSLLRLLRAILGLACFGVPLAHAQRVPLRPDPVPGTTHLALRSTFILPPSTTKGRTRALEGAIIGFVVGAATTAIVTHSGGSTAPCDQSANQDALSSGECFGLAAAGGLVGAGLGALIGSRIRVSAMQALPPTGPASALGGPRVAIAAVSIVAPRY